ncbi:hypothetical protein Poli38472_013954 [Pythium oligandrum]|uniref:Polyprotein n=1 Tax=Pythium oligandrum TaxID=41045 RepID=A0A8K1C2D9_PYTOL|nr:hypothetical protein Poli38472_013954 [Pythium oligandrum]|eukprot:TMW55192.1 hypothetical protein Poli38472_013954 [Pythium oligandrum]
MSPNTAAAMVTQTNDILTEGNYFLWAYGTTMTLAKKGLRAHIDTKKEDVDMTTDEWKVNDEKAFAIVSMRLSPPFQMMVRNATTAVEAWSILERYFVKRNLHNRVNLRKKLHELRMAQGEDISEHMLKFDDLVMAMEAIGDLMEEDEKLVVLLGSVSSDYDGIVRIIENKPNVDLLEAKEMLRREYERMQEHEVTEAALRVGRPGRGKFAYRRQDRGQGKSKGLFQKKKQNDGGRFQGKCYRCNKFGHKEAHCPMVDGNEHVFSATCVPTSGWIMDSGATSHMTFDEGDFVSYKRFGHGTPVEMADGNKLSAVGSGAVRFKANNGSRVTLTQVLHVPGLDKRLISVPALAEKGVEVHFKHDMCVISHEGKALIQGPRVAKSYTVRAEAANRVYDQLGNGAEDCARNFGDLFGDAFGDVTDREECASDDDGGDGVWKDNGPHAQVTTQGASDELHEKWHARIMHVGDSRLADIVRACDDVPANLAGHKSSVMCDACIQGKMCVESFPRTDRTMVKTTMLLEVIYSDVMGPMRVPSLGKARYAVTFVDDFSRLTMIYFMKSKSEVLVRFKAYKAWIENQLNCLIKCIRTDNGGEYVNRKFDTFCQQQGITHQLTVPYSPQQNGVAERMNRTIGDATRSTMIHRKMDRRWWAEVMAAVVHVLNRIPTTVRPGQSPFEICFKARPSLGHLRVIGSEGFAHIDKSKRGKLEPKAFRCILVGYSESTKGYRVWNKDANKLEVVRSVVLQEVERPQFVHVVPHSERAVLQQDDDDNVMPITTTKPSGPEPMDIDDEGSHETPQQQPLAAAQRPVVLDLP